MTLNIATMARAREWLWRGTGIAMLVAWIEIVLTRIIHDGREGNSQPPWPETSWTAARRQLATGQHELTTARRHLKLPHLQEKRLSQVEVAPYPAATAHRQ